LVLEILFGIESRSMALDVLMLENFPSTSFCYIGNFVKN
jgi:hypothetical protein